MIKLGAMFSSKCKQYQKYNDVIAHARYKQCTTCYCESRCDEESKLRNDKIAEFLLDTM